MIRIRALLPRLAFIALLLSLAASTYECACANNMMRYASIKSSVLSLTSCQHFGVRPTFGELSQQSTTAHACRFSQWAKAFAVRGGSDNRHDNDIDIDKDLDDEMQRLRRIWSDVPATPAITWPVTDIVPGGYSTNGTLVDDDGKTNSQVSPRDARMKALIVMDGFSPYHGQYIAHAARQNHGTAVIHVLSDFMTRYLFEVQGQIDHLSCRLPDLDKGEDVEAWTSLLPSSIEIAGIYCESDSGLEDAEKLGAALKLYPKCHDGVSNARRDKYLMNKVVSEVGGLDVVKQKSCSTIEEAEAFAIKLGLGENEHDGCHVVVKPLRGVASDDVHLCSDLPALRKAFRKILNSPIFGSSKEAKHEQALVQEFAAGIEYAVDVVCRNGERKVAALWRYDKRAINGAPFVYFSTELLSITEEGVEQEVCKYVFTALDALGVRWGLSHVEVIVGTTSTGMMKIRLVEVNCRQHNTDFMPLTNACMGYNALDMVLAAFLGDAESNSRPSIGIQWDSIPAFPTTHAYGAIVHFVSHVEGIISRIRFDVLEEIEDMPSVMDLHVYPQFMEVGNPIVTTVDIRSDTGWAHIMNDNEDEFRRDYTRIVELMKDMFEVETYN